MQVKDYRNSGTLPDEDVLAFIAGDFYGPHTGDFRSTIPVEVAKEFIEATVPPFLLGSYERASAWCDNRELSDSEELLMKLWRADR